MLKKLKICILSTFTIIFFSGCNYTGISKRMVFEDDFYTEVTTEDFFEYGDSMKIEKSTDIDENAGAELFERTYDHKNSLYYPKIDFYNLRSRGSVKILHNFKTYQQTGEYSDAQACILEVLEWYDKKGDFDEKKLCDLENCGNDKNGTSLKQVKSIFDKIGGFKLYTTYDIIDAEKKQGKKEINYSNYFNKDFILQYINNNTPIIIFWKQWGGHWITIIGYDDMGTDSLYDDVIIAADSYDVSDHNQDGYITLPAVQIFEDFSTEKYFENDLNDYIFAIAVPEDKK